ncbi:hypothetical protein [Streptomyces sp. NBC_01669]|uniref:hypothetical protein n=1 Tax=unclassified Streptomyces TaxID=2593676 RepID=UPI002259A683|nr:hypothetical protein [Streptomyces sp. NBC_01669]MCX4538355.1 hypothetical protein [Streptomyces sp. NBC_01669]
MASVVGLLEERERGARQRVEVLREEADRVLAELRDAERFWERFVIAREAVVEVLADPDAGARAEEAAVPVAENAAPSPSPSKGAVVPAFSEGRQVTVLSAEYQRIVEVLASSSTPLACKEVAERLGVEPVAAKLEGVRSKANRLVRRGWLVKEPTGRFALAAAVPGGGS